MTEEERKNLKSVVLQIHSEDYMKMLKMNKALLKTFAKRMKEEKEKRNERRKGETE